MITRNDRGNWLKSLFTALAQNNNNITHFAITIIQCWVNSTSRLARSEHRIFENYLPMETSTP